MMPSASAVENTSNKSRDLLRSASEQKRKAIAQKHLNEALFDLSGGQYNSLSDDVLLKLNNTKDITTLSAEEILHLGNAHYKGQVMLLIIR